jgi:hypothetical protein
MERPIRRYARGRGRGLAAVGLLLLLGLVPWLVACTGRDDTGDFGADRARMGLQIGPPAPDTGAVRLVLRLTDPASGAPIAGATVAVEGTMTHAGMQPVLARARDEGDGRYQVDAFRFTMGGDWLLITRVTLPGGTRARHTFALPGIGAGGKPPSSPVPTGN